MLLDDYQQKSRETAGSLDLTCLALGLTGEAGEIADLVKKEIYHGHPPDHQKVKEELGDLLWYLAMMAECLGFDLSEVAEGNLEKLKARYPNGFEKERSINRGD